MFSPASQSEAVTDQKEKEEIERDARLRDQSLLQSPLLAHMLHVMQTSDESWMLQDRPHYSLLVPGKEEWTCAGLYRHQQSNIIAEMGNALAESEQEKTASKKGAEDAMKDAVPFVDINRTAPLATRVVSDAEAASRAAAASAREEGIIRDIETNCKHHLCQNSSSPYANLYQENTQATSMIDPGFPFLGNTWLAVFQEAKKDVQKQVRWRSTAVSQSAPELRDDEKEEASGRGTLGSLLDFIVGIYLVLGSVSSSFAIESCAACAYCSYWLCRKIGDACSPLYVKLFLWFPLLVAWIVGESSRWIHGMLLTASTVVIESVAAASYIVCMMLARSHDVGKQARQTSRKLSHLVRWAFRKNLEG